MCGTEVIATKMRDIFNFYNFQIFIEGKKFLSRMIAYFPCYYIFYLLEYVYVNYIFYFPFHFR